jgi:Xaa-Pro aminopeptidase
LSVVSISSSEYARRRRRLMNEMEPGSIAVIPAATLQRRNRDIFYPFRQDSDFYYLTGFSEPDALLVLVPLREQGEAILFCREKDPKLEQRDGVILGPEAAVTTIGVDDAFPVADEDEILPGLLESRHRIYMTMGEYPSFDARILSYVAHIRGRESGGAQPPGEFVSLKHLLHEHRLFKSPMEIALMRQAAEISANAHLRAMRKVRLGMLESQLEAELVYEFMRSGAVAAAYPSIVGGGENACVLHYTDNNCTLNSGELVLIDAGCEYQHYAGDITRTLPINGSYSPAQKALYNIVLAANKAAIELCRPGQHFNAPHEAAVTVMVEGLIKLGILQGVRDEIIANADYLAFCPHKSSHWLGIDVHDVGDYRLHDEWRPLQPGMVLTIEPGIYIPRTAQTAKVPEQYRGMGIRIEDDVLITEAGYDVLSSSVAKETAAIEKLMQVQ